VVEDQTVELLVVEEGLKVILVGLLLDHLEDLQVAEVAMAVLVILVEQVVLLMNKMVGQEQILVLRFQVYLTLVYMLVVEVELQELVNHKEEKVGLVVVVMEKEDLIKKLDQMQLLTQAVEVVEAVALLLLVDLDLMVDLV
tara:strand:+ start:309 stop:731 length:423 start_codon:yes stop_codon:yes gene_type:complete